VVLHLDLKPPLLPLDICDLCKGQQLDVEMPADLDQFGGDNSHGAVIGREGLVELGHDPSDGGGTLHEVNVISGVCEIEGRLHASDAAPDHHDRTHGFLTHEHLLR
jgi:hypothetical protein